MSAPSSDFRANLDDLDELATKLKIALGEARLAANASFAANLAHLDVKLSTIRLTAHEIIAVTSKGRDAIDIELHRRERGI